MARQVVGPDAGKVWLLAAMTGYRQFIGCGFHADLTLVTGLRHEADHPGDGATLDDFYIRAFVMVGWQREIHSRFYANIRGGGGFLVIRSSHQSEGRFFTPAADLNLGVRF